MTAMFDPIPLLQSVPMPFGGWWADMEILDGAWRLSTRLRSHNRLSEISSHERLELMSSLQEAEEAMAPEAEKLLPAAAFSAEETPAPALTFTTSWSTYDENGMSLPREAWTKTTRTGLFFRGGNMKEKPISWAEFAARAPRCRSILDRGRAYFEPADVPLWHVCELQVGPFRMDGRRVRAADHERAHETAHAHGLCMQSMMQSRLIPSSIRTAWIHRDDREAVDARMDGLMKALGGKGR